jgi:hypothetical protein
MTVTSTLSALLGALEGHDLAPEIHEAIADANAALMREESTEAAYDLVDDVMTWAADHGGTGTDLGGILARHGLVNAAEVARLREQVAEALADWTPDETKAAEAAQVFTADDGYRSIDASAETALRGALEARRQRIARGDS